jgi:hypothetical protein
VTPEQYARVRELFFAVFEQPLAERRALLDDHATPREVRAEVEALLAQHDELTTFLDDSDLATLAAEAEPGPGVWVPGPGERWARADSAWCAKPSSSSRCSARWR